MLFFPPFPKMFYFPCPLKFNNEHVKEMLKNTTHFIAMG